MTIRLQTLGGHRVFKDGQDLTAFSNQPLRTALLVVLAIDRDTFRENVCALLWPEMSSRRARHSLRQMLLTLRKDLGEEWLDVSGERLTTTDALSVDFHQLAAASDEGRSEDVVETYQGPFLDGENFGRGVDLERWIERRRGESNAMVRKAHVDLWAHAGHGEAVIARASAWVDFDPLDDEAQHALIQGLASAGKRTEALDRYDTYCRLLETDLQLRPLDHTEALVADIRNGAFSAEPAVGPSEVPPRESLPDGSPARSRSRGDVGELSSTLDVLRPIGSGRTGVVYLAREPALKRLVAVKLLDNELARQPEARARFEREVRLAARVFHPNVASVYTVGADSEGVPYFVMPYVKGITLADLIRARGPLSTAEVRRVVGETASALAAAHAAGVIHRDIRPANVLYEEGTGRVFVVDFGVAAALESADEETARLTRTGELLGNAEYVSPEQGRGETLTGRSDVYSLGVLGWELLYGRPAPGRSLTSMDIGDAELIDCLRRATAEKASHRPSATQMADMLLKPADSDRGGLGLFRQILRRRLLPIVGGYVAGGFVGMQAVDQLVQQGIFSPVVYVLALAFFIAGLNVAIVVGWFHGERGRQAVGWAETLILSVIVIGWVIANVLILR